MKTNHSKLPWIPIKSEDTPPVSESILDSNGTAVVPYSCSGWNADPEDIEFIVRCANNFYPLLEACKEARAWIMKLNGADYGDPVVEKLMDVLRKVNAEGEES